MDKGFFDEDNFAYLEDLCIEYICKAKLTGTMRKVIKHLDEQEEWQPLSQHYAAAEITLPLPKWSKSRRFVLIRETQKPIRGKILKIPGNIVGNNRYRHVKLAPNPWLEKVLRIAKEKLQKGLP